MSIENGPQLNLGLLDENASKGASDGQLDFDLIIQPEHSGICLVNVDIGKIESIRQQLREIPDISGVNIVAGEYDFVCRFEDKSPEEVGRIVIELIQKVDGVDDTTTLISLDQPFTSITSVA